MPFIIPAVIAVASAVAGYAAAAALGLTGITASIVSGVVGTVVAAGLSYATRGLMRTKKPSSAAAAQPLSSGASDTKVLVRSSVEPRRVIYGQARVSGPIIYACSSGTDSVDLNLVIALAGHPVHEISTVWINEDPITLGDMGGGAGVDVVAGKYAGKAVIVRYNGSQSTADPSIITQSPDGWSADHKLLGIAYLYVRLTYDRNLFQGVPNISALVKGKNDIYDPRSDTSGYTDNWALCIHDYLRGDHGLACGADEINVASFIAAANLSDEAVNLDVGGTTTQKRYTLNGTFTLDRAPIEVMEDMLDAGGGALVYVQGEYRLHGGAYSAPTASLGISDFAGPISVSTRTPRRELFNAVRGTFIDPNRFWQASEFAAVTSASHEAEDGERIWRDVEMPFITDNTRAQRLARQLLLRQRESLTIEAPLRYASLALAVWDTVAVTIPYLGFSAKPFRIVAYKFSAATGEVSVTLREEQAASYAWTYDLGAAPPSVPDTTLVSPLVIPSPSISSITATTALQGDGSYVGALEVVWTAASHPFLVGYEVQWKPVGGSDWNSLQVPVATTRVTLSPVVIGQEYNVRVRGLGNMARGAWSSTSNGSGAADTTAPAVPSALSATGTVRGISLAWTPPADTDLAAVEVWENTSASTVGRYYVGEGRTGFFRSGLPTSATRWYWIRSRDRSGNTSAFVGSASATSSFLLTDDIGDAVLGTAKFAQSIRPVEFGTALPGSGNYEGRYFYVQPASPGTPGTLYRYLSGAWTTTESGQPVTFPQVVVGTVSAAAVSSREIAADAIKAVHLASEEVVAETVQVKNLILGYRKFNYNEVTRVAAASGVRSGTFDPHPGWSSYGWQSYTLVQAWLTVPADSQAKVLLWSRPPNTTRPADYGYVLGDEGNGGGAVAITGDGTSAFGSGNKGGVGVIRKDLGSGNEWFLGWVHQHPFVDDTLYEGSFEYSLRAILGPFSAVIGGQENWIGYDGVCRLGLVMNHR